MYQRNLIPVIFWVNVTLKVAGSYETLVNIHQNNTASHAVRSYFRYSQPWELHSNPTTSLFHNFSFKIYEATWFENMNLDSFFKNRLWFSKLTFLTRTKGWNCSERQIINQRWKEMQDNCTFFLHNHVNACLYIFLHLPNYWMNFSWNLVMTIHIKVSWQIYFWYTPIQ